MQHEEPPSPRGRKAFHISRRIRVIYNLMPLRVRLAVCVAFVLVLLSSSAAYAQWHQSTSQSSADSERVAFVVSNYLQLDTLQPALAETAFSTVAFAGENVGGLPASQASLRQYVVQSGDTLSTIATKYDLHTGSIVLANEDILDDTELIHPGQLLFIPDTDATPAQLAVEQDQRQQRNTTKAAQKVAAKKTTVQASIAQSKAGGLHLVMPMPYFTYISQPFSFYKHPAIDFATSPGTPVRAVADGCIVLAAKGWNGGYGNTILLDVGHGYVVRYAHLTSFNAGVSGGACFNAGDPIASSGNTGNSTGPHLHFEVRLNGVPKDPMNYLP